MGFEHRKLMDESPAPSINITLSEVCQVYCDPSINDSGYCISPCLDICPRTCRYSGLPPGYPVSSGYPPAAAAVAFRGRGVSPLLLWVFMAVSFAVLFVLVYLVWVRLYRRNSGGRRNRAQPQRALPPRDDEFVDDLGPVLDHPIWYIHTVGLDPSVISKIAVCKYKRGEGLVEGAECSVCLTEFNEDETLRLLPKCSHAFHVPCIDTWLRSYTNCPNCRAPIATTTTR